MDAPVRAAAPAPLPLAEYGSRRKGARVCIIGGGGTGAAAAYDLALRGFDVTLIEKGELTSGTTGRHHGQLHCGARYAWNDRTIAKECYEESLTLTRIAPECIEYNGGIFVALSDEEAAKTDEFIAHCAEAGIPASKLRLENLRRAEPGVSREARSAVLVPDGSFDAFRLPMMFFAAARALGARILPWHEAVGIDVRAGRARAVIARDLCSRSPKELRFEADFILSAAGAWAGSIGTLAGVDIPVAPAPGVMVALKGRFTERVISRLRPPDDGDIFVPQRALSIIGSTQRLADSADGILPSEEEIRLLRDAAAEMIPSTKELPVYAAWAAARPLANLGKTAAGDEEGRSLSRDFVALDHQERDGIAGFASLIGGKATVLRAMGEKAADLVCRRLGVKAECRTSLFALPSWRDYFREQNEWN